MRYPASAASSTRSRNFPAERYLGARGRLGEGPAPELIAAGFGPEAADGPVLARGLSLADMAHAVALHEAGALSVERASALLAGLLDLDRMDPETFPWDPAAGDAFNSRERVLSERVGPDAAGWLSAGRPRREAFRVALRLLAREGVLAMHGALVDLAEAHLAQAERYADAVAADYTYLQPAQPSTVGHLVLAWSEPVLRDAERLARAHEGLDLSVAGAGGTSGSAWPIDRERLAELLGCAGVVSHTRDAMWQTDGYLALLSDISIAMTTQSQWAQDLEILASQEFAMVRLADRHSRASALMPQKRNPYALAVIRESAGAAAGDLMRLHTTLHTGSARTDHFHGLNGLLPRRIAHATATTALSAAVAADLTIDAARWGEAAHRGFTAAADVADLLARDHGLDYRTAHTVVGRAVRARTEAGAEPAEITAEDIAAAARDVTGAPIDVPADALSASLDPAACAQARSQTGSSSRAEVARMIASGRERVATFRSWAAGAGERAAAAERRLRSRAAEISAG